MALIQPHTRLNEVILNEPAIIPVINRFDITLGVGDKNIETICLEHNLNVDFFLSILNTYINEDYFPEKALGSFCITTIVEYLRKTDNHYLQHQLPIIQRHFRLLIERSGSNNNLDLMLSFFNELKEDIEKRISFDFKEWFPAINLILSGEATPVIFVPTDSEIIEDKLNDLKNMFITHLTGNYDTNLCYAVIASIISLENDIRQNNRIRDRIVLKLYNNLINNK